MNKDANALLQTMKANGVDPRGMSALIQARLALAQPLVMVMARDAAAQQGTDKDDAVKTVLQLMKSMGEDDFIQYEKRLAKLLDISLPSMRGLARPKKAKSEKGEGEPKRTAGGWIGGYLLQLCYDPEKMHTWFAVRYPDGRVEPYADKVEINGQIWAPMWTNSIIVKHGVRFPSQIHDHPLSEAELLHKTRTHINNYFDFGNDDFFQEITPHWVEYSYFAHSFMEASYLRMLGDYGTGKTRFLKAVGLLCHQPIYVTGGSSAASIYHYLDVYRGTLILNEADFDGTDEASIIAKILNGGTERDEGISKMRKDAAGNMEIEMYNVFGPKVIATRKSFNDRAIESRCLTMEMMPMAVDPRIPRHLPSNYEQITCNLRNLWATYRLHHAKEEMPIDESETDYSLEPRLSQISGPLMSLIAEESVREAVKNFMRVYNERERTDRYGTKTARVLEGVIRAWAWGPVSENPNDGGRIYLKDIAAATNQVTDEMNKNMGDDADDMTDNKGRKHGGKMTSRGVADTMKKYLQLRTQRATDGIEEYKGTMFVDMTRDQERVEALCKRWGVEPLKRGSLERPALQVPMSSIDLERLRYNSVAPDAE